MKIHHTCDSIRIVLLAVMVAAALAKVGAFSTDWHSHWLFEIPPDMRRLLSDNDIGNKQFLTLYFSLR